MLPRAASGKAEECVNIHVLIAKFIVRTISCDQNSLAICCSVG